MMQLVHHVLMSCSSFFFLRLFFNIVTEPVDGEECEEAGVAFVDFIQVCSSAIFSSTHPLERENEFYALVETEIYTVQ